MDPILKIFQQKMRSEVERLKARSYAAERNTKKEPFIFDEWFFFEKVTVGLYLARKIFKSRIVPDIPPGTGLET